MPTKLLLNRDEAAVHESILETHVDAVLAGHDVRSFERVEGGKQVSYRRCG